MNKLNPLALLILEIKMVLKKAFLNLKLDDELSLILIHIFFLKALLKGLYIFLKTYANKFL